MEIQELIVLGIIPFTFTHFLAFPAMRHEYEASMNERLWV
jgi:hypothetical protein